MRDVLRLVVVPLLGLSLTASASNSSAQTAPAEPRKAVRVVAETASIRLNPDPNSTVLGQVAAGTVLELGGSRGAWYAVWLPGEASLRRLGYLSMSDAEALAGTALDGEPRARSPLTPPAPPAAEPAVEPARPAAGAEAEWRARVDRARARRSSGIRKFWLGTAIAGGGMVMGALYSSAGVSCNDYSCTYPSDALYYAAIGSVLGGGALSLWGTIQWIGASHDLSDLSLQDPQRMRSSRLHLPIGRIGDSGALAVSVAPDGAALRFLVAW